MSKLCGNCSGDHKYIDCPYIEKRITKTEWRQILEDAQVVERLKKQIAKLEELTHPELNRMYPVLIEILGVTK